MKQNLRGAFLLFFVLQAICPDCSSQSLYKFSTGLAMPMQAHYGRDAVVTDALAFALYSNTMKTPVAGEALAGQGSANAGTWTAVTADTSGAFRLRGGTLGYLYLAYQSPIAQSALLRLPGANGAFVNGVARMGDPYEAGWMAIPVSLKKGLNEFYVRGINCKPSLQLSPKPFFISTDDATLPTVRIGEKAPLDGAIVVTNSTDKPVSSLTLSSVMPDGGRQTRAVPPIPAMSTRKISFRFETSGISTKGKFSCTLILSDRTRELDRKQLAIEADVPAEKYKQTFTSQIDGSLQYYAVRPQKGNSAPGASLFLSVHGAGVEAIGQASAYKSKDWGNIVAATNRRPRGFNWEDWGRLDALEVLAAAKAKFQPDPNHIYLTGHSMGGHGTWYLGATYPGIWAGLGVSAGYPSLKTYGSADGQIPDSSASPMRNMLIRANNQSDVPKLASNYTPLGIYILHGDIDDNVPVSHARYMRGVLSGFHADFAYHEVPGANHWFGDESVDWPGMFDFFKDHRRLNDSEVNEITFMTSSPGISHQNRWAAIWQQEHPLNYSRIRLSRDLKKNTLNGNTQNVATIRLALTDFGTGKNLGITIDGQAITYTTSAAADTVFFVKNQGSWKLSAAPAQTAKGPHRYGTFKEAFRNKMVFVYGTAGTPEENRLILEKIRFDAETWYYRGNGDVDILSDKDFLSGTTAKGRNAIFYGNANTNLAYASVLKDCPIQVNRGAVVIGSKNFKGDDLAAYFTWPSATEPAISYGVIAGSGLAGMRAAMPNQYFAGGSGFPDFMVFRLSMLKTGIDGVEAAGFFSNDWKLDEREMVVK